MEIIMNAHRKVLVTGSAGYIASQILPTFRQRYNLTLLDIAKQGKTAYGDEDLQLVDLHNPDIDTYKHHFQGIDTVVHLAWRRSEGRGTPGNINDFTAEYSNILLAQNIYRVSLETGVSRVVVASSNHAADWYEHNLIHSKQMEIVEPYQIPLSDNFYGWAKATYEHLGFVFATGVFGRRLENVQIRIGAPRDIRLKDSSSSAIAEYKRDLGAYISPRDLTQLFVRSIEAENIEDELDIPWLVVYGISDNTRNFWSLQNARQVLDYTPEDDSEIKYFKEIQDVLYGTNASAGPGRVGP
ncbi:NAD(P)-dependent oxidoreductase [SAR202 cluster bacterium AD-804-J14_MRT_500m]|nr:NAD(P)-dependent oxidoreductase [SAR202 cluster bacterium AD-804-J14_MRT_500m]